MLGAGFIRVPAPGSSAWMTGDAPLLERRFDLLVHLAFGAHHGGEFTPICGTPATTDRRVDDMNALLFRPSAKVPPGSCSAQTRRGEVTATEANLPDLSGRSGLPLAGVGG